jgi:hypothetical protein
MGFQPQIELLFSSIPKIDRNRKNTENMSVSIIILYAEVCCVVQRVPSRCVSNCFTVAARLRKLAEKPLLLHLRVT